MVLSVKGFGERKRTLEKSLCNSTQSSCFLFLCNEVMLDSFHSEGMMAFCKLLLIRDVSDGAILGAHSFSKRTGILSGPQDLLGSSLTSSLYTRLLQVSMYFGSRHLHLKTPG